MRKLFFAFVAFLFLAAISCKDKDNTATLELKINPTFGNKDVTLYEPILDENGQKVLLIDKLYFYISDLKLNEVGAAEEILLIDLEDVALNKGITAIKSGNYNSITLGLGVNEKLNHTDPASYENSHPLGSDHTDKQWTWETGYIFYKIEGKFSTQNDGKLDGDFLFHMGRDELFRTITINKTVNLVKDGTTEVVLNLDFEKLFCSDEGIDLKVESTSQAAPSQAELNEKFINRLVESIE